MLVGVWNTKEGIFSFFLPNTIESTIQRMGVAIVASLTLNTIAVKLTKNNCMGFFTKRPWSIERDYGCSAIISPEEKLKLSRSMYIWSLAEECTHISKE